MKNIPEDTQTRVLQDVLKSAALRMLELVYICEANSMTGLIYSKDALSSSQSNPLLLTLNNIMEEAQKRKNNKIKNR